MLLSALIIVRRRENRAKCTIQPLRGTPGLDYLPYPLRVKPDLSRHLLLTPDAPPLTAADAGRPLLLLDASWRHAVIMRKAVEPVEARSIPPGWRTAYLRVSKVQADPDTGLATEFAGGPLTDERKAKFRATIPLGRFSTALDVANAALYLASDEAAFISGVCIEVDGARCV